MRLYFIDPFGVKTFLLEYERYSGCLVAIAEFIIEHYYIGHRATHTIVNSSSEFQEVVITLN